MIQLSELKSWIAFQQEPFLNILEDLVNINTYTTNVTGVDQGMNFISQLAQNMGFHIEVVNGRNRLIKARNGRKPRVILLSHMDTVHPPDSDFNRYEVTADDYAYGPGVGDIKSGLLMGLWTLLAFKELQSDAPLSLVISADEEIGSPGIRDWYLSKKCAADYAIGLEPGFPQGPLTHDVTMGVVKQRKGCGRVNFTIKGKAAHAGGEWKSGLNAIEAVAQRVTRIHALVDESRGITTNVGLVNGGTAANTIAETCSAVVDFRFLTQSDGDDILETIQTIINERRVYNPYLKICEDVENMVVSVFIPPMEHTEANQFLVDIVLEEAQRLDQAIVPIVRGGGSDANYTSRNGIPSICGMGAPAEGIHTKDEKISLPLLFERLELLISTVHRLVQLD